MNNKITLKENLVFDKDILEEDFIGEVDKGVDKITNSMKDFTKQRESIIFNKMLEYVTHDELYYLHKNNLLTDCFIISEKVNTDVATHIANKYNYTVNIDINVEPFEELNKHLEKFRIQQKIKGF